MDNSVINQPLPCLPKLIEQPTWGGRFILNLKGLDHDPYWQEKKVGQSYELFGGTPVKINNQTVALQNLLVDHSREILGKRIVERFGPKMPLLLKLTQAKGNSFQLHPKPGANHPRWRPKAEAWYYLETGLLTLGVKSGINWTEYEKTIRVVAKEMEYLSRRVREKQLPLKEARQKAKEFINNHNPANFVNQITAQKGEVWDLSAGGLHHSWEENGAVAPHGNLVYEIQEDLPDEVSSIRAFDKGKLRDDGTVREVHVEDYFRFVDRSPETNNPNMARRQPKLLAKVSGGQVTRLLKSPCFQMELITVKDKINSQLINPEPGFHHLFAKAGKVIIVYGQDQEVLLNQGSSVLIPASLGSYELRNATQATAELIKSFVS